ncbi:MAG TPA: hypothetical protein VFU32_04215 [Ktedonobacterales bacterium]|nr:hypothetical protein [Ktedonobacterales bacterium]
MISKRTFFQLPVVAAGAEYLVMGYLMRRNILAYKAPPGNEGYDLICIHPDPRHHLKPNELAQVRVQVKSRYATDHNYQVALKEAAIDAFDYLVVAFMNIGFYHRKQAPVTAGQKEPEFYTLPTSFVREHHTRAASGWENLILRGLEGEIEPYKNESGFELIAQALGIDYPSRLENMQDTEVGEE